MPRYGLVIAYEGTAFCGWQKQEPRATGPDGLADAAPMVAPAGEPAAKHAAAPAAAARASEAPPGQEARDRVRAEGPPPPRVRPAYSDDTPRMVSTRDGRVALRTVQGVVERAVRDVVREHVELIGASRTDSGVHARGQVAAFTCEPRNVPPVATQIAGTREGKVAADRAGAGAAGQAFSGTDSGASAGIGWPLERGVDRLAAAINSRLPEDVMVQRAFVAGNDFDPIGDAVSKGYSYTFHVGPTRPLWDRRLVHHVWDRRGLDAPAMHDAAQVLVGEHDFAAFAAAGHGRLTTVRRVLSCAVAHVPAADGQRVRIDIAGTGFLWNMVRIIAGTLMQVGLGQRSIDDVRAAVASRRRDDAGPTLPPTGLCLEWIKYDAEATP